MGGLILTRSVAFLNGDLKQLEETSSSETRKHSRAWKSIHSNFQKKRRQQNTNLRVRDKKVCPNSLAELEGES